ncbi:tRNA (N(6)-L-threonylcarbamoyladenosine(37)-C(2))-methylthiotransferase MtaB [Pelagibius sp.]|uniref:tRNA (N(6)-L-threonylcarbamoyladenosine(37)-C(2))- methylthiotransferase MtaB n=1 Tax=Pelagibius sp. TaxID=1931238 RepID=UPI002602471A|nr:tRNA (N(6)-L-threonylcarbamoyladenosine(37)-C(2))-methylthiotransferase MtaB [Pelagibius sp.]
MSPRILTFGCRLNAYESEVMRGHAETAGLEDTVIVNTCAVTAEAERQARQAIRKARREQPGARIIVTGCAAQIDPAGYAAMPEVDRVLGNEEKLRAESFGDTEAPRVRVNDIMAVTETAPQLIEGFAERTRAFVQVQQGCGHRCTFCIIPYGRGNSRSVPLGEVVRQIRALVERGVAEVVLTGVDITSYGGDLPGRPRLGQMLRRLLAQVPGLQRLRLSSLDAIELDPDLRRLLAEEPRLMPHLHLSLQAGDDMILKRMKRRHARAEAVALCDELRRLRPDIVFGADLIAGFPTETEAMFENSLALVEDCGLTYLHVFPYSPRRGTPAAKMPQVPAAERKDRAARLRTAGEAVLDRFLDAQLGRSASVLIEKQDAEGRVAGHSESFAPVVLDRGAIGTVVAARVTGREGQRLTAVPLDQTLSPAA